MPLTNEELKETALQRGVKLLLQEWLASYFDGQTHDVGLEEDVPFPLVPIAFDQSKADQPLNGTEIRVILRAGRVQKYAAAAGQQAWADSAIQFDVRGQKLGGGAGDSNLLVDQTVDLLMAILNNPAERRALAQKGIHRLRGQLAETVASKDYKVRTINCKAKLVWLIQY
jgi:hypothetical protein